MTYLDLLNKASLKAKEARGILDSALEANRELSDAEMERVRSLGTESDRLREQAEALQAAEARTEWFAQPLTKPVELPGSSPEQRTHRPGEVRCFKHGERISERQNAGNLSLGRLIRGMAAGRWDGAESERRVMSTLSGVNGGILVPETLSMDLIDLFRAESVLSAAGMSTIVMQTPTVIIPKIGSDPTAAWVGENQEFSESGGTLDYCQLTARKLGVLTKASLELIEDSTLAAQTIERLLSVACAQGVDTAALTGSGVGEPLGISNESRIEKISMGANGAALTNYSKIIQAIQILMENNVPTGPGEISVIMSPREWATLTGLTETSLSIKPVEPPAALMERCTFRVCSKMPTNLTHGTADDASQIIVGRFSEMSLGVRTEINIEASRQAADSSGSAFRSGQVWIRSYLRCDVAIRRPGAFVIIDGITA